MSRLNWGIGAEKDRKAQEAAELRECALREAMDDCERQQQADVGLLEELLGYDGLSPSHRTRVEMTLEWLKAAPRRSLGGSQRKQRQFFDYIADHVRAGTYRGEKSSAYVWKPAVRAKVIRPEWMGDKSKLPMKPPQRS